jgi:transposase
MELWRAKMSIEGIAATLEISRACAFRWNQNLLKYGSIRQPPRRPIGRPHAISLADEKALFMELQTTSWYYQDEIIHWLAEERGVTISQLMISKMLKRNK